jgi:UDP-GlcNAc:undecaprenyl-phosphate GlcNAc-1-phosphate transferase
MFAAVILIPPMTSLYQKLNIVDLPSARKVHSKPIPRVGGVAIIIASVIPMLWWFDLDKAMIGVFLGIGTIFVMGVLDDAYNLNYKIKFILQALSIALIFYFGFINIDNAEFNFDNALLNTLLLIIYFVFILGVTNAINLADGLDGLAGGVSLLSFSIIGLLAYESNNTNILVMVIAIIGAVFGFLRFNSYPAKIFMGDTGSLFLGFILGLLSVSLTYAEDSAYAKMLPLLLVGLPLFDTALVFIIRLSNRKSPFHADRNHFHHRLLDHGLKHYQSVLLIYLIQSIFVLTAFYMRYSTELGVIFTFITLCLLLLAISIFRWD